MNITWAANSTLPSFRIHTSMFRISSFSSWNLSGSSRWKKMFVNIDVWHFLTSKALESCSFRCGSYVLVSFLKVLVVVYKVRQFSVIVDSLTCHTYAFGEGWWTATKNSYFTNLRKRKKSLDTTKLGDNNWHCAINMITKFIRIREKWQYFVLA